MRLYSVATTMAPAFLVATLWATSLVLLWRHGAAGQRWHRLAVAGFCALLVDALLNLVWLGWILSGTGFSPMAHRDLLHLVTLTGTVLRLTGYALMVAALLSGRSARGDQAAA